MGLAPIPAFARRLAPLARPSPRGTRICPACAGGLARRLAPLTRPLSEMHFLELTTILSRWLLAAPEQDAELTGAEADSRRIRPGMLFCAIRGAVADGARFIPAALQAGAAAILCEGDAPVPQGVPVLRIRPGCGYPATARVAEWAAGFPARRLRLYGITGTCGKSTTAYLFRDILRASGRKAGMIGTVVYDLGGEELPADRTTPTPFLLQNLFRRMADHGVTDAVLEVSSAALDQERLGDARFDGAVFTNFSRDHLDYHGTMENYYLAKRRLFTDLLAPGAPAVVNLDDEAGRRLAREIAPRCHVVGFSLEDAPAPFACRLPGRFNQYNAAAAGLLARAAGLPEDAIRDALLASHGAPGRLERHDCRNGVALFIDYAHTPEEIAKALDALRPLCHGRLAIVFGCGGDRDRGKRPQMAAAAAAAADLVWITSDNPRTEDPQAIIDDILPGLPPNTPHFVEPDRAAAIRAAVAALGPGDFLLVAGKGHEAYQEIQGVKHPYSDQRIVEDL